jgi:hypothetical protein
VSILNYVKTSLPLIWVETAEEMRAIEAYITEIQSNCKASYEYYTWDCADGIRQYSKTLGFSGEPMRSWSPSGKPEDAQPLNNPGVALEWMEKAAGREIEVNDVNGNAVKTLGNAILFLKDFHPFLDMEKAPNGAVPVIRKLRNLKTPFSGISKIIVIVSPIVNIPAELNKEITVVPFALPDRAGLKSVLAKVSGDIRDGKGKPIPYPTADEEALIDAALGMTAFEAENAFAVSFATLKKFDAKMVRAEKANIIRKDKILEVVDTNISLKDVGGLRS